MVGTGSISAFHVRAYQALGDRCTIVALCNPNPGKAEAMKADLGLDEAAVYTSHRDVIARGDVDLVSICSPPSTHEEISVDFLDAGIDVLCEKPMAPSLAACDAILAAEARGGARFSPVAQNRYRDDVVRLRAAVESGLTGPVSHVAVDSTWWRGLPYYDLVWRGTWEQEGGGCTLNHAVHHIDLLLWLLGTPDSVTAVLTNAAHENAEVEDLSVAVLTYGRALATVTSSVVHHGEPERIVVQGRDAGVTLRGDVVAELPQPNGFPAPDGHAELVRRLRELAAAHRPLAHTGLEGQIDDVVAAAETGRRPSIDSHDGRRTIELITAIYQAGIERRTVDLPIADDDPYYRTGTLTRRAPRFFAKTASVRDPSGTMSVPGSSGPDRGHEDAR